MVHAKSKPVLSRPQAQWTSTVYPASRCESKYSYASGITFLQILSVSSLAGKSFGIGYPSDLDFISFKFSSRWLRFSQIDKSLENRKTQFAQRTRRFNRSGPTSKTAGNQPKDIFHLGYLILVWPTVKIQKGPVLFMNHDSFLLINISGAKKF